LAVDFLAVGFLAVDFLAVELLAEDFFAAVDFAADFLAVEFVGELAVDFAAVDFAADVFFVVALVAVDLLAVDLLAVDLVAAAFAAADLVAADLLVADLLVVPGVAFLAGDFLAADFVAVDVAAPDVEAADLAAADFVVPADFFAGVAFEADLPAVLRAAPVATAAAARPEAVAFRAAAGAAAMVSLGSFFAPETTFFRSAPAVNFGTAVFLARICSPVRGLRTMRAARTRFSKEPNPVMATLLPLATSRVIVSSTDSRAWAAALRFPSKRADSVSISCDLFTVFPSVKTPVPSPCSTNFNELRDRRRAPQ
jgi:hypothetical protein